jgi:hypothetical protein
LANDCGNFNKNCQCSFNGLAWVFRKNKGCEFEVNLLLNKIALNRILFIGYEDTIPLIKNTIERKFETLEANSPNKDIKNAVATIFKVKKENNKETQFIMDLLIKKGME